MAYCQCFFIRTALHWDFFSNNMYVFIIFDSLKRVWRVAFIFNTKYSKIANGTLTEAFDFFNFELFWDLPAGGHQYCPSSNGIYILGKCYDEPSLSQLGDTPSKSSRVRTRDGRLNRLQTFIQRYVGFKPIFSIRPILVV